MKRLTLLPFFVLLCSCGGHLKLSSKDCSGPVLLERQDAPILYSGHFWHKSSDEEQNTILIKDLLLSKNLDCAKVKNMSIKVGQNAVDQLLSFIPLVRRSTVTITGETF